MSKFVFLEKQLACQFWRQHQFLKCFFCQQMEQCTFCSSSLNKSAVVFECGHKFCETCANHLLALNSLTSASSSASKRTKKKKLKKNVEIVCPGFFCGKKQRVDVTTGFTLTSIAPADDNNDDPSLYYYCICHWCMSYDANIIY